MNNLLFATSLALLNNERFVVHTLNYANAFVALETILHTRGFTVVEIDLLKVSIDDILSMIIYNDEHEDDPQYKFKEVIVFKNMENCGDKTHRQLTELLDELNEYDSNNSRLKGNNYVQVRGKTIHKAQFGCMVAIIEVDRDNGSKGIYKRLKERFWFSQFYIERERERENTENKRENKRDNTENVRENIGDKREYSSDPIDNYKETLLRAKDTISCIHQSHEITGYIYSLITHIRNHRLCTMSQLQMRLHTDVIDKVSLLAKSIIAWKNRNDVTWGTQLYVTPEYCKVSMRKIGYWLIQWQEENGAFDLKDDSKDMDHTRSLLVSMLGGEWYGSEWEYVKEYLVEYQAVYDTLSNTGFSNKIIEECISAVRPPI